MTDQEAALDLRLVPSAVLAWLMTAATVTFGWRVGAVSAVLLLAVAGCHTAAVRTGRLSERGWGVGVAACLAGAGFALAAGVRVHAVAEHPLHDPRAGTYVTATVVISDDPRPVRGPGPSRVLVEAELRSMTKALETTTTGGAVVVIAPTRGWGELLPGQLVDFRASVEPPLRPDLSVATLRAGDVPVRAGPPSVIQRFAGQVRARFAAAAESALPGDAGTLLPALVVGDTSRIGADVRADFRTAGLTHLLAVSGANVAIVLGALLLLARGMALGPVAAAILAAIGLALFVVLARPSPSVLRAAVMGAIGLLGMVVSRRKQAVPALAAAVLGLLVFAPELAVDAGFALSVLATAGLIALAPTWADRLRAHRWPRALAEAVAVAAAAFVVTAPVIAALNGTVSVVSVVANLAVCFVIAPITVLGACAAVLCPWWFAGAVFAARLCDPLLRWLLWVAEEAAALPYATIPVRSGSAGAAIVFAGVCVAVAGAWWYATRASGTGGMARSGGDRFTPARPAAPGARRRRIARRARCVGRDRGGSRARGRGG